PAAGTGSKGPDRSANIDEPGGLDRTLQSQLTVRSEQRPVEDLTGIAGPQNPGVSIRWESSQSLNVGQESQLKLVVHNSSQSIIREVVTEAILPRGLQVVSTDPDPNPGVGTPTWTFGNLRPDETRTIAVTVIPRDRGELRLDASVRLTGYSAATFTVQEPQIAVDVTGPEKTEIGQPVSYTVRVSNPGTGIARNVTIQAAVPEGLVHRRGSMLSIEVGTLEPGESRQARLNLTAVAGGHQDLAVRAIAEGGLEHATLASLQVAEPQLGIAMQGPDTLMAGRTGVYVLKVTNQGDVASANVRAKLRLPADCEFIAADRGGKFEAADQAVEWFVGNVQPGEESLFEVTLKPTVPGELLAQAGVMSELGKVSTASFSTAVDGTADLKAAITASARTVKVGDEIRYRIEITNHGSRLASNVGMSCELSPGLKLIDVDGPSDRIAENGVIVFRSLPEIAAGKSAVLLIHAECIQPGDHNVRLRVASESITAPLIAEERTSTSGR
ncbi:MAG: DUF11 domain-containing protein, partial [Planctomycetaceae bacterium]|nr:DUF11 domain-containing protein [Planctomycetaceae bacterium]